MDIAFQAMPSAGVQTGGGTKLTPFAKKWFLFNNSVTEFRIDAAAPAVKLHFQFFTKIH